MDVRFETFLSFYTVLGAAEQKKKMLSTIKSQELDAFRDVLLKDVQIGIKRRKIAEQEYKIKILCQDTNMKQKVADAAEFGLKDEHTTQEEMLFNDLHNHWRRQISTYKCAVNELYDAQETLKTLQNEKQVLQKSAPTKTVEQKKLQDSAPVLQNYFKFVQTQDEFYVIRSTDSLWFRATLNQKRKRGKFEVILMPQNVQVEQHQLNLNFFKIEEQCSRQFLTLTELFFAGILPLDAYRDCFLRVQDKGKQINL